jgi:hypothetical protein
MTALVYIYARIPQIAEMTLSFHATAGVGIWNPQAKDQKKGEMHKKEN